MSTDMSTTGDTRRTASAPVRYGVWAALLLLSWLVLPVGGAQETGAQFDHDLTGFLLNGAHRRATCDSCHLRGIFKGTPRRCEGCHGRANLMSGQTKPANHIPSTNTCDDCHTEVSWAAVRMDHMAITGACTTCHNNRAATGKSPQHIQTTAPCDECHRTLAWSPARFNHDNVTGTCFSCHNGTTATGKSRNHVQSSNQCEDCHSTRAWLPAGFDHSAITAACFSCHNGTTARGKSTDHVQSNNLCEDCHSTNAWTPASFDHSNVTGSCSTCHNGTDATGKNNGHFVTTLECDSCHSTTAWRPAPYTHTTPNYPGDHRANLQCRDCHSANNQVITWQFPAYQPDCAGCHAGDFRTGPHKKTDSPETFYTVGELRDCTGSCHIYQDATLTTIATMRSGEHRVNAAEW